MSQTPRLLRTDDGVFSEAEAEVEVEAEVEGEAGSWVLCNGFDQSAMGRAAIDYGYGPGSLKEAKEPRKDDDPGDLASNLDMDMELSQRQQWERYWQQFPRSYYYHAGIEHGPQGGHAPVSDLGSNSNNNNNNNNNSINKNLNDNGPDVVRSGADACVTISSDCTDSRDSPTSDGPRPCHVFQNQGYAASTGSYPATTPTSERASDSGNFALHCEETEENVHDPPDLFPDLPEAKKRKFILVEDVARRSRLRVRATLENVDTREIPDSFRKGFSVYPRSYFPREMQEPPPSATGVAFFPDDVTAAAFERNEVESIESRQHRRNGRITPVKITARVTATSIAAASATEREEGTMEVSIPRMRMDRRSREVRLNDLGHRMAWLQSRVFAGRPVFLQRALDCYRAKTLNAMEIGAGEGGAVGALYAGRPGKQRWEECVKKMEGTDE